VGWVTVPLMAPTPMAGADPTADCSAGVIVAVNYATWSGPIDTVCDAGTLPATAAYALQTARFDPVGVASYGLAFICQIGGDPPGDSCQSTPPADAYWSFWYADSGNNSWTYSTVGAMGLEPQAGSVEYWVFGGASGTVQPLASPDTVRSATQYSVTSTTVPAPTGTGPPAAGTGGGTNSGSAPSAQTTSPGGHASPVAPTTTTPATTTPTTVSTTGSRRASSHPSPGSASAGSAGGRTSPTEPGHTTATERSGRTPSGNAVKIVSVAPTLARQPPDSPLGLILGGIAVVALVGTGGFIALRRRRVG
jgi:hypothetical protein